MNKNLIAIWAAIAIVCVTGFYLTPISNADSPKQPRAAIVLGYQEITIPVAERTPESGSVAGIEVIWISASPGCPTIYKGEPLGVVIGKLLEAGFRLEPIHQGTGRCLLVR